MKRKIPFIITSRMVAGFGATFRGQEHASMTALIAPAVLLGLWL